MDRVAPVWTSYRNELNNCFLRKESCSHQGNQWQKPRMRVCTSLTDRNDFNLEMDCRWRKLVLTTVFICLFKPELKKTPRFIASDLKWDNRHQPSHPRLFTLLIALYSVDNLLHLSHFSYHPFSIRDNMAWCVNCAIRHGCIKIL